MSFQSSSSRPTVRRVFLLIAALGAAATVDAQSAPAADLPESLNAYVTTATRTPEPRQTLGSAVDVLSADELAREQVTSLAQALGAGAALPAVASGAPGSATSLFLRGANSNQTLFLVDGIRFNDPNTDYQVVLGGGSLGAGDRIEIARGPQSTLYGSDAIGGVISLTAVRGTGAPSGSVGIEAGSFGTVAATAATQGANGATAWNVSARASHTDNDRPDNAFDARNVVARVDRTLSPTLAVGGTVRWFNTDLESPGDRFTKDPNNRETESNLLATAFADVTLAPAWKAHVTLGGQDRRYIYDQPVPNPPWDSPAEKTVTESRRGIVDLQNTFTGVERNRLTTGATAETLQTRSSGFGAIDQRQRWYAVFAEDEYSPIDNVYLTAGGRYDDFDTFGSATTGRATIAWLVVPKTVKLRASYGTGFRAPSFLDLYGKDPYYVGNPNLRPERARSGDAGVDFYLPDNRGSVGVTWFDSEFTDLIAYDFGSVPSTVVNLGRARTQGVEVSGHAQVLGVDLTANYAYLEAQSLNATGHARLLRRPRQQVGVDLHRTIGGTVTAGVGASYFGERLDVDAQTYAETRDPGYVLVRAYVAWQALPRLTLKLRVENALDRRYEPVNGYPALGAGAFAGADWRF